MVRFRWIPRFSWIAVVVLQIVASPEVTVRADVRIKDITTVAGVRTNKLTGIGMVTGLNGTGGKSPVTREIALNLLQHLGIRADPLLRLAVRDDAKQRTDNLSVVIVTAELPAFAKKGSRFDVMVSAYDDAQSLQGGTLVLTPLQGIDNMTYALASGPVSIGGFSFSGQAASIQKNHPTTGRIPSGAVVEEEVPCPLETFNPIQLLLQQPDFETARRVAQAINTQFPGSASTLDAGSVVVTAPMRMRSNIVGFIGAVGSIQVKPDSRARVVINERTGTVVIGENVRLSPVAITHANLSVITGETPEVVQPLPQSKGNTTIVPRTKLDVVEEKEPLTVFDEPATVGDLARALNALGVTPRDLSSIFQQLKEAGALHAQLEFN